MLMRCIAIVAVVVALAPSAHAEDKQKAREAYERATQDYDLGEYKEALDAFKEAYRNFEDPAFLFNIAQCDLNSVRMRRPCASIACTS